MMFYAERAPDEVRGTRRSAFWLVCKHLMSS